MKIFLTLLFLLFANISLGGTCSSISRSNYSANSVLTSSALNLDFNTVYGSYNAIDGGCVTDGTLEFAALNVSDFASITNGIHQGCTLAYSDANTISVGKCIATVNGFSVKTAVANTVTWSCSGCSSEVSATTYYVYIKTGSSGTTLNLLLSTTAPGIDGYDASSNKVIGKFYNNSSSDIEQYSIESWSSVAFIPTSGLPRIAGATNTTEIFSVSYGTTAFGTACSASPCSHLDQIGSAVTSVTRSGAGNYSLNTARTYSKLKCVVNCLGSATCVPQPMSCSSCSALALITQNSNSGAAIDSYGVIDCKGTYP